MTPTGIYPWTPQEHCIYISLGSNIRPVENLPRAVIMMGKFGQVISASKVWETKPVGTTGPSFLNAAVLLQVFLPPELLKSLILRRIEIEMGRIRTLNKNAPRPIDLDILIADGQIVEPAIWTRAHLAVPLAEIYPELLHPVWGKSLAQIAQELIIPDEIRPRPEVRLGN